ncbi:hypothetical protein ACP70R_021303 [Stipagrostis hirtigluma subsp. patula]
MAPAVGIVDISSDEEDSPVGNRLPLDPLGWASDLFDADADDVIGDDFDELMIMSELSSPPVLQKKPLPDDLMIMSEISSPPVLQKKTRPDGGHHDDDDGDCVVLDGDPDKAVTIADEEGSAGDGSSDELQIVAEKGLLRIIALIEEESRVQHTTHPDNLNYIRALISVACRDLAHARHLCSNLPFSSTSHAKYCNMCYCFVCDDRAPCNYWGNGTSITDHCHATDKEGKWKTLRQAFKGNCLPASGPEKRQNFTCSTVASPTQQTQAMQCQVAFPQSFMSSVSNMDHPSLANRGLLLNELSQNQQRHPSVRLSLSVGGTVRTPRAGGGTGSAQIAQNNCSRAIFKRAGALSQGLTTTKANPFGAAAPDNSLLHHALTHVSQPVHVAPRTNALTGTARNNAPQRSFSAPLAFQAQQGEPTAYCQVASNGMDVIGPELSRCSSLTTQRTQCLQEPVIDVSTKSWEDILASVASDLGVPDYSVSAPLSQHLATNSGPVHSTASQGSGLQHKSVAASENFASSHVHDSSNHAAGGNVIANEPLQTTENVHHLNCQSSFVPNDAHLNDFASSPADESLIEAARELEISRLESANILFEFDWV